MPSWRISLALAGALAVGACYAELDWREFVSPEGGFAVMLPGRPAKESRVVAIGGTRTTMQMVSVQGSGMAFGVGYADLPPDVDAARVVSDGRAALVNNIGGRVLSERPLALGDGPGVEVEAEGTVDGRPMRLAARVLTSGSRFYQVAFIARAERAAEVDRALFPGSFRLLR